MPYIRDQHFTRVKELLETAEELAQNGELSSLPQIRAIIARAIKICGKYSVEVEEKEKG